MRLVSIPIVALMVATLPAVAQTADNSTPASPGQSPAQTPAQAPATVPGQTAPSAPGGPVTAGTVTAPSVSTGTVTVAPGGTAGPGAGAATAGGATLTLEDAIKIALANNELIGQNETAAERSRARVREVAAGGLPQVNVTGQYLRQKEVSASLPTAFDQNGQPTSFAHFTLSPAYSKVANANLTQVIDVFGLVRMARKVANLGQQVQELNIIRSRSEVIYETRTAYYNALRAAGAVEASQASVTDAEEQLRLARAFVSAGTAPQFDVTRAEVNLADRQQTLISARDGLELAGAALNNVLARPVDTPIALTPVTETPDRTVDIAAQTDRALQARPEIVQADLGVRAGEVTVDLQRRSDWPRFGFGANYNYNFTASGFSTEKGKWNAGVNVAWPIWNSGATRARVQEAQADVRTADLQRQQLRRSVSLEVRQAGLRVQETADRFAVADKAVGLAEEALRLSRVRYQNGVTTQLEVTDAETALTIARFNRVNTLYDYLTARANFDAAIMGRLYSPLTSGGSSGISSYQLTGGPTAGSGFSGGATSGAAGQSSGTGTGATTGTSGAGGAGMAG